MSVLLNPPSALTVKLNDWNVATIEGAITSKWKSVSGVGVGDAVGLGVGVGVAAPSH